MTAAPATDGRCPWAGNDPLYVAYHDEEWGVPKADDRALFEKLVLEGFQAGLAWITILRKREHLRRAFDNFEPERVARFTPGRVEALLADPGVIRHRGKIEAAVANARACLAIQERQSFAAFLWSFVDHRPIENAHRRPRDIPATSPHSVAMAKALKAQGFRFCGPTTLYAFMQSVGMVNDHLVTCPRHAACAALARAFRAPRA